MIELCVERIINGIVEKFQSIREKTEGFTPFEKLEYLGNMTLDFLFEHYAVSKISVLTDMKNPKPNDNTHRKWVEQGWLDKSDVLMQNRKKVP